MILITSLVRALVKADGDAVVLDSGLKPYMVANGVEMTIDAPLPAVDNVDDALRELLPPEQRQALERLGAIEYELPPIPALSGERLTVVVVRAEPSVWVEIRRDRAAAQQAAADSPQPAAPLVAQAVHETPPPAVPFPPPPPALSPKRTSVSDAELIAAAKRDIAKKELEQRAEGLNDFAPDNAGPQGRAARDPEEDAPPVLTMRAGNADAEAIRSASLAMAAAVAASLEQSVASQEAQRQADAESSGLAAAVGRWVAAPARRIASLFSASSDPQDGDPPGDPMPSDHRNDPAAAGPPPRPVAPEPSVPTATPAEAEPPKPRLTLAAPEAPRGWDLEDLELPSASELWPDAAASIDADGDLEIGDPFADPLRELPVMVRPPASAPPPLHIVRSDREANQPVRMRLAAIELPAEVTRLLRLAASLGATSLHLMSQSTPAIRVQGEMQFPDGEHSWSTDDLEALLQMATPYATQKGARLEWVSEVPEVGRVLCSSVREHRGVTATFGLPAAHGLTAEDLGLPPEVQALALEREGLILVTGARSSDKRQIITAFVDLVNRLRRDFVVTLEHEIHLVHQPQGSVVSQREVRGGDEALLAAARGALEENPDVVAFDDLQSDAIIRLALKAAGAGHLVIAGLSARTATGAIDAVLGAHPLEDRPRAQATLAEHLCGVVTQTVIRQPVGPGVIAREVLLNTPSVAKLIAAGRTSQLSAAIEEGRASGMVSLDQTLLELVRTSAVDIHEAYRRAGDRAAFVEVLQREGIDTSILEPPR